MLLERYRIYMKFLLTLFFFFSCSSLWAQAALGRTAGKLTIEGIGKNIIQYGAVRGLPAKELLYWRALAKDGFYRANQAFSHYLLPNTSTAPSGDFLMQNSVLFHKTIEKYLHNSFYLKENPVLPNFSLKTEKIDYTEYIPYDSRVILLGEVHEVNWIVSEVEQAVYQYKKTYPHRNIYYASEFVDASEEGIFVLGNEEDVRRLVRKRPYYREVTHRLIRAGINVVGLENPELSSQGLKVAYRNGWEESEFAWKVISPAGMKNRNVYWSSIIRQILLQDPEAVVLVHAGLGHTGYNQIESLPWQLKEFSPYVVEFMDKSLQNLNPMLEEHAEIPFSILREGRMLQQQYPQKEVKTIRHFPGKRSAVAVGCDLNISRLFPKE